MTNSQIPAGLDVALRAANIAFDGCPVSVKIETWDESYGDVLPDAVIWATPRRSAFKPTGRRTCSYHGAINP